VNKFDFLYFDMAERIAHLSHAIRLKVGCVIVKENRILSYGYNGTIAGFDNNCEEPIYMPTEELTLLSTKELYEKYPNVDEVHGRYYLKTKDSVVHAECNALLKICKSHENSSGASVYLTHSPCIECAKMIASSGISKVFYIHEFRSTAGIDLLYQCNIDVQKKPMA